MKWQSIRLWLAVLALLALSVSGFWGVDQEWSYATSLGEKFSTFVQIAYAVLGLLAAAALLRCSGTERPLLYLWAFTLLLTGATAPVIWGRGGWMQGLSATAVTAFCAGLVIWLAPLPPAGPVLARWRWALGALFAVAALGALTVAVRAVAPVAPVVLGAARLEQFCEGMRGDITERELADLVGQQGYAARPGDDAKGHYLRIEEFDPQLRYRCEARFKPGGTLSSMNFTANHKD